MSSDAPKSLALAGAGNPPTFRQSKDADVINRDQFKKTDVTIAGAAAPTSPSKPKIVLKSVDMNDAMRDDAYEIARAAFEKFTVEKEIAEQIKKEFDNKHGPTWHCIVGRNFGSYVTHERNHFLYFYVDSKAVLLFKSG